MVVVQLVLKFNFKLIVWLLIYEDVIANDKAMPNESTNIFCFFPFFPHFVLANILNAYVSIEVSNISQYHHISEISYII